MNRKFIKYIIEMIFIFIIPLSLLSTGFKIVKTYDENNNEVGKYLSFDNVFVLNNETQTFYNYEYYDLNEVIYLNPNDYMYINYNKNPFIQIYSAPVQGYVDRMYFKYDSINQAYNPYDETIVNFDSLDINYNENSVMILRSYETIVSFKNTYGNIVKDINTYTINKNSVNLVVSSIYNALGIVNNWILQFIVIYFILILVMFVLWHLFFIPLDKIFHLRKE